MRLECTVIVGGLGVYLHIGGRVASRVRECLEIMAIFNGTPRGTFTRV